MVQEFGVVTHKNIRVSVASRYWIKEPQNLTDYFKTFYVVVNNRSNEPIVVKRGDFTLLDSQNNQYDAVKPSIVAENFIPKKHPELFFNFEEEIEQKERFQNWQESKTNLLRDSFHFGKILPNAKKSGFIFFPAFEQEQPLLKFYFKEFEIKFVKRK